MSCTGEELHWTKRFMELFSCHVCGIIILHKRTEYVDNDRQILKATTDMKGVLFGVY
jgi:hypothetical protein